MSVGGLAEEGQGEQGGSKLSHPLVYSAAM